MPLTFFESLNGCEGPIPTLHGLVERNERQVASRAHGQQIEPDVGRRGAVRHDTAGVLLKVVGRQMVIEIAYESLEEAPGLARHTAKRAQLLRAPGLRHP